MASLIWIITHHHHFPVNTSHITFLYISSCVSFEPRLKTFYTHTQHVYWKWHCLHLFQREFPLNSHHIATKILGCSFVPLSYFHFYFVHCCQFFSCFCVLTLACKFSVYNLEYLPFFFSPLHINCSDFLIIFFSLFKHGDQLSHFSVPFSFHCLYLRLTFCQQPA